MITALEANPIGVEKQDGAITSFIENLKTQWDEAKIAAVSVGKITMVQVVKYLLICLDGLIVFVDGLMENAGGADKKATVLAAVAVLYDYVVKETMPIWLKPFASTIKVFIIYTIISIAIDWIVSKYRGGLWRSDDVVVTPETTPIA